ncbi:MAG: FecR domain-containing protein [SAR324 cluster bacterium]|nr:FecR domain-containing protein [SAR324 cluster bacterium]MBL7036168.1 FecR domain-containing protein [SAR324 cluster bacterium]
MPISRWCFFTICFLLLNISAPIRSQAKTVPALAILGQLQGEVTAGPAKKMLKAVNGKLLWSRYRVRTEKKGRATIYFNDDSELHLFGGSELTIGAKKSRNSRWVRYRLFLHSGSFWAHFVRGKAPVEVGSKGIRLQLADASLRFSKKKTGINVTVPSGTVKVFNRGSSIRLHAGQRLYQVQQNDSLPQKVSLIPNQLSLRIEPADPVFSGKDSLKLKMFFQVVRFGTERQVKHPGLVHLKSSYYNVLLPDSVRLSSDGSASTSIEIKAPSASDRTFSGSIIFQAIMDQSGSGDVQDGRLKVKLGSP